MHAFSHIKHKTEKMGLVLLICGFMLSAYWSILSKKDLNGYPELINYAGQQRMLSQKLAYLTQLSPRTPDLQSKLNTTLEQLSSNSRTIITLLKAKGTYQNDQAFVESNQLLVNNYRQVLDQAIAGNNDMAALALYEQSQVALAGFEQNVAYLQSQALVAEKTFSNAVLGAFGLLLFIVWYFFQMLVKPRLVADKKALVEYSESLTVYKRLFDDSKDSMLIFDSNWQLMDANRTSFEQINQRNTSLSMANGFWLNNALKGIKRDMAQQLNEFGSWDKNIAFTTGSKGQQFMSASAIKIAGSNNADDYYGVTLKDITVLQNKQKETEKLARTDSLTGILNRSAIIHKLSEICLTQPTVDHIVGVLFIDLDGFKKVNDIYGHSMGDKVLQQVSRKLSALTNPDTTLARLGGDEFLFVCENVRSEAYFETFTAQIKAIFASSIAIDFITVRLGVSIGISLYPSQAKIANDLVQYADIAMYNSKNKATLNYTMFDDSMLESIVGSDNIETQLRQAASRNELRQVYQPIINLDNLQPVGAELLMRWTSAELGPIFPDVFIPMAEKSEAIYGIDQWSFDTMLQSVVNTQWTGYVSINLSSLHFVNVTVIDAFLQRLVAAKLPNKFIFEVTETALIEDIDQSAIVINKIKAAGFYVAIDDFGTGYTSLYYLKILPFDYIKIDRSFVSDMCENENSYSIVQAIIRLAKDLHIQVIAEGVETKKIETELINLGCDFAQGYLYEKPIPFDELTQKYATLHNRSEVGDM